MISLEDFRRKADNLYPPFLKAWVRGESFFPKDIPCDKQIHDSADIALLRQFIAGSKEVTGKGYSLTLVEKNSRQFGRNQFPDRLGFQTQDDFLTFIGKQAEFRVFASVVAEVRSWYAEPRYSELESWLQSNTQKVIKSAEDLHGLFAVVEYLRLNPQPDLYLRELPLPVDTKFIERNQQILREWLDLVLDHHAIRADETDFERRYGLRYIEPHIHVRFLDDELLSANQIRLPECSIPLNELEEKPLIAKHILIVENKVSLLALRPIPGTIALGGLGNSVTVLKDVAWLREADVWYWGDIDVDGLAILSRLRKLLPTIRSLLMDYETLIEWRDKLARSGVIRDIEAPTKLFEAERSAYDVCLAENLRIEQEQFPKLFIEETLRAAFGLIG